MTYSVPADYAAPRAAPAPPKQPLAWAEYRGVSPLRFRPASGLSCKAETVAQPNTLNHPFQPSVYPASAPTPRPLVAPASPTRPTLRRAAATADALREWPRPSRLSGSILRGWFLVGPALSVDDALAWTSEWQAEAAKFPARLSDFRMLVASSAQLDEDQFRLAMRTGVFPLRYPAGVPPTLDALEAWLAR